MPQSLTFSSLFVGEGRIEQPLQAPIAIMKSCCKVSISEADKYCVLPLHYSPKRVGIPYSTPTKVTRRFYFAFMSGVRVEDTSGPDLSCTSASGFSVRRATTTYTTGPMFVLIRHPAFDLSSDCHGITQSYSNIVLRSNVTSPLALLQACSTQNINVPYGFHIQSHAVLWS